MASPSAFSLSWLAVIMFHYTASLCFLESAISMVGTLPLRWIFTLLQLCMDIMSAPALDLTSFSEAKVMR